MSLSFRDRAALAALPRALQSYAPGPHAARCAFDMADEMEAERERRRPPAHPYRGPVSEHAGDSDLDLGEDAADESLGPLVGLEVDGPTRNGPGWKEFEDPPRDPSPGDTPTKPRVKP